jgi:Low-density lipoprotein receptor repeat class B
VFGRRLAGHSHHSEHPLRRRVLLTILGAALLAALLLLIAPRTANGNFVYWTNQDPGSTIGRAKINGTGVNNNFIGGISQPRGVATDSRFIYWTDGGPPGSIGRANLDGSGVNHQFITADVTNPTGIAVTSSGIFWTNEVGMGGFSIGRANLDGSGSEGQFINVDLAPCGLAADSNFVYFFDGTDGLGIGRVRLDGSGLDPNFIPTPEPFCGLAVDPGFLYWGSDGGNTVGRAPVAGGAAQDNFVPTGTAGGGPFGVAVNSQYLFWGNGDALTIGRANINGSAPNPALTTGPTSPLLLAAAPSNKITVNSVAKKKKKGTATINAKVPGPGQVTLNQTNAPPDVNAVEAGVKQIGLTITQASSFKLAVKPTGKTAKKLNKQVKKQLKKKRKAKAKASVTVFVHFVPAGVAGVPNTERLKVTLVKQRKKKK